MKEATHALVSSAEMDTPRAQAAEEQEIPAAGQQKSGAAAFRQAVDDVLRKKSKEMADGLAKNATEGHVQSGKFLYDVGERSEELSSAEIARAVRSLAEKWSTEPLWLPELNEAVAETDAGSREPET